MIDRTRRHPGRGADEQEPVADVVLETELLQAKAQAGLERYAFEPHPNRLKPDHHARSVGPRQTSAMIAPRMPAGR